jgi:beta-lactamase class A
MEHHLRGHGREVLYAALCLGLAAGLIAALPTGRGFGAAAYASTADSAPTAASMTTPLAASICNSSAHPALASRLSRDILAALKRRSSTVALTVNDRVKGIVCALGQGQHFDSASVVKVTILGALLRRAMEQHRSLTSAEVSLTTVMITRSDNNAASTLWARLGRGSLLHFLNLAKMTETVLGPDGYWGLTQITAHDEMTLLRLLTSNNTILNAASRAYARGLMARVIASQRWGVPAGTPAGVTVHVKNGWLPRPTHAWRIHSIGTFSGRGRYYLIVVLTQDNATMAYGVRTIEKAAEVIHRDLSVGLPAAIPASRFSPLWLIPDERIPALPIVP